MNPANTRLMGIIGVIAASILFSTAGFLIKFIDWSPLAIAGIRSFIAAILMLLYLKRPKFSFSKAQIVTAVSICATMFLFVAANKMTTAANAILLQYTAPVYVALFSFLVLKEKVRPFDWLVIALVLIGLSLFFLDDMTPGNLIGNILAMLAGFLYAVSIISIRYQKDASPIESALLGNLLTFLIALPFIVAAPVPDTRSIIGLILLGVFQLGLGWILFATAITHITALEGILFNVIEPLCNPIWVFLLVGEAPARNALIGGIIVLTAVTARSIFSADASSKQTGLPSDTRADA
jgi:drug/metabolite transporter (DMT)-like permease